MTHPKSIDNLSALIAQLEEENIPYQHVKGEDTVSVPTRVGSQGSVLHICWESTPGVVQFIQILPAIVPEPARPGAAVLINRINSKLTALGFVLNEQNGMVAFRTQAFLGQDATIAPGMIGALIATAAQTAITYLPEFEHIISCGSDMDFYAEPFQQEYRVAR